MGRPNGRFSAAQLRHHSKEQAESGPKALCGLPPWRHHRPVLTGLAALQSPALQLRWLS